MTKDYWYNRAEMQPYADFTSFVINGLLIEEKYSVLACFCLKFCNITQHGYSSIVLPFKIHAKSILESKANSLTQEKVQLLSQKTQEYDLWKNSKKRKNRAALLTGEVQPEEIQFQ